MWHEGRRRMITAFFWLVVVIMITYAAVCALLYLQQERLIFFPTKLSSDYQYHFSLPFEEVDLPVSGATINAVYFRAQTPRGAVLYLHGNADLIARLESLAAFFTEAGYDLLIPDYRGYGKSSGRITSEAELLADMEAVYQYLLTRQPEERIVIYGQSLGTGPALYLAAHHQPRGLLLESPFVSVQEMTALHFPWIPRRLLKYPLRNDQWIMRVRCPIYIVHGTHDTVIPFAQGEKLTAMINGEKQFLKVMGGGHGTLFADRRVREFVTAALATADQAQ